MSHLTYNRRDLKPFSGVANRALPWAFLLLAFYVIFRMSWLCDDSLITLNQVNRFTQGFGITWNSGERVQAFTHPLWFLMLSGVVFFTRELFYSALALSWFFSGSAFLGIVFWGMRWGSRRFAITTICLVLGVLPIMEYTSGGLESPLSYACTLGLLWAVWYEETHGGGRLVWPGVVAALFAGALVMTRWDYGLFVLPLMLYWAVARYRLWFLRWILIGAPIGFWMLFSLFYFGLLFPCTYYAKLAAGIPTTTYLKQGLSYFRIEYLKSPWTLAVLAVGILSCLRADAVWKMFGLGCLLYLMYLLKIGGDWMQGRLFAVPAFAMAVFLSLHYAWQRPRLRTLPILVPSLGMLSFVVYTYPALFEDNLSTQGAWGVTNCRACFYPTYGLLSSYRRGWPAVAAPTGEFPKSYRVSIVAGRAGISLNDSVYHIDPAGLATPMMAFMPGRTDEPFLPAHVPRCAPIHLGESIVLTRGEKWLGAPELAPLFHDLWLATHAPLLEPARFNAIVRLNFMRSSYGPYIADGRDRLHTPDFVTDYPVFQTQHGANNVPFSLGTSFVFGANTYFGPAGLTVGLDTPGKYNFLEFVVDTPCTLNVECIRNGRVVRRFKTYTKPDAVCTAEKGVRNAYLHSYGFAEPFEADTVKFTFEADIPRVDLAYLKTEYKPKITSDEIEVYSAEISDTFARSGMLIYSNR